MSNTDFSDIHDFMRKKREEQAQTSLTLTADKNPDAHANVISLSEQTGLPADVVERNTPRAEKVAKQKKLDLEALRSSTALQEWVADPNNAALINDELGFWGQTGNVLKTTGERVPQIIGNLLGFGDTVSKGAEEKKALGGFKIDLLSLLFTDEEAGEQRTLTRLSPEEYKSDESLIALAADELRAVDFGGDRAAMTQWEEVKDQPIKNVLPYIVQQGVVSLPDMAAVVANLPAYVLSRSEELGQDRAQNKGLEEATVQEVLEAMPFATASALLERLGARGVFGLDEGAVTGIKSLLAESGKAAGKEAGTEFIQEQLDYAAETVGTDEAWSLSQSLDRGFAGAVAGGGFGGGLRATIGAGEMAFSRDAKTFEDAEAAIQNSTALQDMVAHLQNLKLFERHEGKARELYQAIMHGEGIGEVNLNATGFASVLANAEGADIPSILDSLGVSEQAFERAVATGSDVQVKAGDLAATVHKNDQIAQAAIMNLRASDSAMTLTEAEEALADVKQRIDEQAEAAQMEDENIDIDTRPADAVYDMVLTQLNETGRWSPQINKNYAELYRSIAKVFQYEFDKAGVDLNVFQWLNTFGFNVANEMTPEQQQDLYLESKLNELRSRKEVDDRKEIFSFIKKYGGIKKGGTVAAELAAADITGKGNPKLFTEDGSEIDNIPASEFEDHFGVVPEEDANGYVDQNWLLDAIRDGSLNRPANELDQIQEMMDRMGLSLDDDNQNIINALKGGKPTVSEDGKVLYHPAWHGSPYRFDKFSLEHIGSGEGAQVYGWGLYFAGKRQVAEWYRSKMSSKPQTKWGDMGYYETEATVVAHAKSNLFRVRNTDQINFTSVLEDDIWREVGNDLGEIRTDITPEKEGGRGRSVEEVRAKIDKYLAMYARSVEQDPQNENATIALAVWQVIDKLPDPTYEEQGGSLFKVELAPDEADYLDWDKPLSEQSEKVKEALSQYENTILWGMSLKDMVDTVKAAPENEKTQHILYDSNLNPTGNTLYRELSQKAYKMWDFAPDGWRWEKGVKGSNVIHKLVDPSGEEMASGTLKYEVLKKAGFSDDWLASEFLKSLGIPGIRYLDGSSRSEGEGHHNYVIFDDSLIEITELYQSAGEPESFEIASPQDLTQTQAFKDWFKDSKVVDENGEPLVVYHGTPVEVGDEFAFDLNESGKNTGAKDARGAIYFTDQRVVAEQYLDEYPDVSDSDRARLEENERRQTELKKALIDEYGSIMRAPRSDARKAEWKRLLDESVEVYEAAPAAKSGAVVESYLSIQDPLIVDFKGEAWDETRQAEINKRARAEGHDGVLLQNIQDGGYFGGVGISDVYVAFSPEQIKSVHNRGTFDPQDPRILYQSGTANTNIPGFYSQVAKVVSEIPLPAWKKGDSAEANGRDIWAKLKTSAVKKEELEWLGIEEFLTGNPKAKFTRQQVIDYVSQNGVRVEEVVGGEEGNADTEIEWDAGEVWDDPEAWQHQIEYWQEDPDGDLREAAIEQLKTDEASYIEANKQEDESVEEYLERDFSSEIQEAIDKAAEDRAREYYFENPIYIYSSTNEMDRDLYIFGNDDQGYSIRVDGWQNWNNEVAGQGGIYSLSEAQIQAQDYAYNEGLLSGENDVSAARWEERVMDGAYENYRELKLTLPDIEGDFYNEIHFPDRNLVAFLRVDDRELVADNRHEERREAYKASLRDKIVETGSENPYYKYRVGEHGIAASTPEVAIEAEMNVWDIRNAGQKTFFIDEFQSDWHQKGRQNGYQTGEVDPGELDNRAAEIEEEVSKVVSPYYDTVRIKDMPPQTPADLMSLSRFTEHANFIAAAGVDDAIAHAGVNDQRSVEAVAMALPDEVIAQIAALGKQRREVLKKAEAERYGEPNAPFKGDAWISLGLKRAILEAVQNDYEAVAWANAEVLSDRWSERHAELYKNQYDRKMPKLVKKLTGETPKHLDMNGAPVEHQELGYWIIPLSDEFKDKVRQEGLPLFQKQEVGQHRGSFNPETRTILFNDLSDKSTFLHETAHFFLEFLNATANLPDAPDSLVQMRDDAYAHLGIQPGEWSVEAHEKWAEGFEAYLQTGKAPSKGLRRAFANFARWVTEVYQKLRGRPLGKVDPALADIFDRLLATEQEIAQAEAETGLELTSEVLEAIDPADRQAVLEAAEDAHNEAVQKQYKTRLDAKRREIQKWWKAELKEETAKAKTELLEGKVYKARHFLRTGEFPIGETPADMQGQKINLQGLKDTFGDGVTKSLPPGYATNKGKVHHDTMAEWLDFSSFDEMWQQTNGVPGINEAAKELAKERMKARHGDLLDKGTLEAEAAAYTAMNKRAEFLEAQVIGIGKKAGRKPLKAKEIKLIVEKDMKRRPLGETTKPNRYLQASIRAGNRVQKALAQGDMDAAYVEKQRQLVNYQMFRVATELQDKVGVYNRRLDRRGKKPIKPGYVDPKFITPIKQLLGAYEYGRLVNATPAEALSAVADFVEKHNAEAQKPGEYEGKTILIPPQVLEEANVKNWQLMSFEDFKALHDAVAQFWKYGRDGSDEKKSDLKKKNEGHAVSIEGNGNIRKGVGTFADDNKKESRHKYLDTAVFAQLRRLPSILYELDGFKVMGDLAKDILPPLEAASVMYQDMMEEATQRIREAFKAYGSVERFFMSSQHTAFHIPELDQTLTKEQVLMMAMNQGTESNKEALVNGKEVLSQDLIDTILDRHMEKRDWDFVQEVIDIQESLWKPVYELEMRDKGVAAEKLEATPIQTKFGEYRGGYHRLKFSPNDEKAAAQSEREAATDVTRWGNAGAQTKNGSTIERVQGHGLQVKLKFDVVFDHLHETIMDVSYREAVRNASQILTSSEVRTAIANTKGPEFNTVISTILRQIAKQDDRETGGWQSTLQGVRLRFVPAIMAYNLKSAWSAWSGLTQAMTSRRLGPKRVLESMGRVLWNGAVQNGPIAEINAKSDMMRQRAKVFNRDIREANNQFGKGVYADEIAKWGYWPMMKMDKLIASIVWDAAEQQALEQGMSNQDAVYYADRMVSDTQSSGEAHELSALHGGGEIAKSLTVFGTYFSSTYNLTTEIIRGAAHDARNQNVAGKAKAYSLAAMDLFILHAVQMFIFTLIAENLPDFEDEEEWQDFYFWEMLSQVAGMVPFGLELVNTARYNFSAQTIPADSVMTQGWRAMNSLKDALPGGDEFEGKDAEAIARFFGTFLGISGTHQAVKSSEYLMTLDDEDGFSLKEFLISGDDED